MASFNQPELVWLEKPETKIRFRYLSEGGSHGGLAGRGGKKTYPTVKLLHYYGGKTIFVCVSLYTEDEKEHVLEFRGTKHTNTRQFVEQSLQEDKTAVFTNLQILSKKKHEIEEILMDRKLKNLKEGMNGAVRAQFEKRYSKEVKSRAREILNSVRLYVEAFEIDNPNVAVCSLLSDVICNQKAASKGDLRICRLSQFSGSWKGDEEIILLCEKVQKDNIKVKFFETDNTDEIIWEDYGKFSPADVHYQVAIPFRTPRYRENVRKTVFICLERNGEVSEPREFTYKPDEISIKKRKLNNDECVPIRTKNLCESDFSASDSSRNISSPDSTTYELESTVPISNDSNLESDGNDLPDLDETSFNMYFNYLYDISENDEDYKLPFEKLICSDDDSDMDHDRKENLSNQSLNIIPKTTGNPKWNEMKFVGQMGVEIDGAFLRQKRSTILKEPENQPEQEVQENYTATYSEKKSALGYNYLYRSYSYLYRRYILPFFSFLCKFFTTESNSSKNSMNIFQKKQLCSNLLRKRHTFNNTVLHIAVLQNRRIELLLKMCHIEGIDIINAQNNLKQSALHLAAEKNDITTIRTLLKYGSDPNLKDINGNNCCHIAAYKNFYGILCEIINVHRFLPGVNDFNDEGLTPFHIALMRKSNTCFGLLMQHMTNPNLVEKKAGKSLLHYAVDFNPIILYMLQSKLDTLDVDIQDFEGNTPLHIASARGDTHAVQQLLYFKANPKIKNFKRNFNTLDMEDSEDTSDGEIPADLATNTEICEILGRAESEINDLLKLPNCDNKQASNEIPKEVMEKLCSLLNREMKWKSVAGYLLDANLTDSLSLSPNPTKKLLDYIKKQDEDYIQTFKRVLELAELNDAVKLFKDHQL